MNAAALTLNVVGCGKLGTTLPRLLSDAGAVRIAGLYSRSAAQAEEARRFIGHGAPASELRALPAADLWLVAVSDDAIADTANQLAQLANDWRDTVVFHASGLHDSRLLAPLAAKGGLTASLHPAHSFADREKSLRTFAGTCCALEGHPEAKARLTALFSLMEVRLFEIEAAVKPLYHAATAMASNYLVSLLHASLTLLEKAGIAEADASTLLAPLVNQTAGNVFARGPVKALTGPISRGDRDTVARHLSHVTASSPELVDLYLSLGRATLDLAREAGLDDPAKVDALVALLQDQGHLQ
ncbi:MAG TPA: Rossmann-like and DUF2520 domain-containing protein [Porticoccaceae bacterium]